MLEVLPIRVLTDEDAYIFGSLNVALAKLLRADIAVGNGIVVTPPSLKLKTTLEHYDFGTKEVFEQTLTLVRKEISSTPIPEVLVKEIGKHNHFLLNGVSIKSAKNLWLGLLNIWLEQIKDRLWREGFHKGITEELDPQVVIFVNRPVAYGTVYFDPLQDDSVINVEYGKVHPNDLKKLDELVRTANKKLFIPHQYEWVVDLPAGRHGGGVRFIKVLPHTPVVTLQTYAPEVSDQFHLGGGNTMTPQVLKSAVKVFLDLSSGLVVEREVDGIYIASEKIFDLNKPRDSFDDLVLRVVEAATTFEDFPILFKLADKSEGMGKVRGTLRLLHQQSLFQPMVDVMDFVRHKRGISNVHMVIPFVRGVNEFLQLKRELAVRKLSRKNSLELWLEVAVPENVVNLEDYLVAGLDGVVLNLDELIAHLNGFDHTQEDLVFYKNEVSGLLKFLEDGLKLLHKSKVPFIVVGSLSLYPEVLEFLVEKGVYGVVVERYEAPSAHEILHNVEKRLIVRRSNI